MSETKGRARPTAHCDHQFVFLRTETYNEGYDRNPTWVAYDVFYCQKCLEKRKERLARTDYVEFAGPRNEHRRF